MIVLVYGATGRVGCEVIDRLRADGHSVIGLHRTDGDFAGSKHPAHWIRLREPDLVINCVAMNGMERCAADQAFADLVNAEGPRTLAKTCKTFDIPLIHFSTDYVFSGSHNQAPLLETFPVEPCGAYGHSKFHGEPPVVNFSDKNLVFRLSSIYGRRWEGPVDAVRQATTPGRSKIEVLRQFCAPTSARTVANAIAQVVRVAAGRWEDFGGIYHLATTEGIWKRDFARELLSRVLPECSLEIVEGELELARPVHSFLCSDKFEETFSYRLPTWSEDLEIALPLMEPIPC